MNIIVTGATRGMGRSIAEKFAAGGDNLVVCARSAQDLENLKKDFSSRFPEISIFTKVVDIGDSEQVKGFGRWIIESKLTPDVLVNNAGYFVAGNIYGEDEASLEKMMNINLGSAYHLTRSLLASMMERKRGHIFNICSIASLNGMVNVGSYGISKFALYGFTKHLREEMKPHGIKVTAVVPGATYTSSWEGSGIDPERIIKAEDIADMIFACSRLSASAAVEDIVIRPQLGDL